MRAAEGQRRTRGPLNAADTIEGLYGKKLNLTASRVDKFFSCPSAFFLSVWPQGEGAPPGGVCRARDRHVHPLCARARADGARKARGGAAAAGKDAVARACREAVDQYIREELGGLANKTPRFRYLFGRLVKSVQQILDNVIEELRVSEFRPIDYEVDFSRGGDLPPVTCEQDGVTVSLAGKVDRVDGYIRDGRLYLRVMDYKSGKKSFSLSDIWYGLNMQLIIYLYALQEEGLDRYCRLLSEELNEIVPAGVLYVPVRDDIIDGDRAATEEELHSKREAALRRSGLLSEDMSLLDAMEQGIEDKGRFIPIKLKKDQGRGREKTLDPEVCGGGSRAVRQTRALYAQKAARDGRRAAQGQWEASPCRHDRNRCACDWCDYRAACHFDESAGDCERPLKALDDSEVWELLGGDGNA